jgi:hypothetical protein
VARLPAWSCATRIESSTTSVAPRSRSSRWWSQSGNAEPTVVVDPLERLGSLGDLDGAIQSAHGPRSDWRYDAACTTTRGRR